MTLKISASNKISSLECHKYSTRHSKIQFQFQFQYHYFFEFFILAISNDHMTFEDAC